MPSLTAKASKKSLSVVNSDGRRLSSNQPHDFKRGNGLPHGICTDTQQGDGVAIFVPFLEERRNPTQR
ncbi:MAG: hypothetical protein ACI9LD_002108 [Polaromonas sp.]|jgi:hypothetical protein